MCDAITAIGGRIKRGTDNGLFVDGPAEAVTPAMRAALQAHWEELDALVPREVVIPPTVE